MINLTGCHVDICSKRQILGRLRELANTCARIHADFRSKVRNIVSKISTIITLFQSSLQPFLPEVHGSDVPRGRHLPGVTSLRN